MDVNVFQHFRSDEHPFIESVNDWLERVSIQYAPHLTEFLDPRQAFIVESITGQRADIKFRFYGGHSDAERCRCLLYPDYFEPTENDFEIKMFEINYPKKFSELSHGKILGTLINSGIRRDSFGDIITDGQRWQIFTTKDISRYLESQTSKIGNVSVRLEESDPADAIEEINKWENETTTASSLRLDVVISSVYAISRQRSKQLIESGKVKVNWTQVVRPDFQLAELDIVSVRGFGRIQLVELDGKTKKDKFRINIGVLRK